MVLSLLTFSAFAAPNAPWEWEDKGYNWEAVTPDVVWSLKAEPEAVCPGAPFVVSLSGVENTPEFPEGSKNPFDDLRFRYQYKVTKPARPEAKWTNMLTNKQITRQLICPFDMPEDAEEIQVRALDVNGVNFSSNVITITRETNCPPGCHTSTTGDYIQGTDFDPKDDKNHNPRVPKDVEDYFGENHISFNNNRYENYQVLPGLNANFGGLQPSKDKDSKATNYYYNFNGTPGNATPFVLGFPKELYHGKNYTYVMRLYVLPKPGCDQWSTASIQARTGHGTVTDDYMEVTMYNDRTQENLGTAIHGMEGGRAIFYFTDIMTSQELQNCKDLLRVELTFYGKFPDNQQENLTFTPMFENLQCGYVAIDYISAQAASICMDKGAVCVGNTTTINAAGFPRDAVYNWEEYDPDTNEWTPLVIKGETQIGPHLNKLVLPVRKLGVSKYRMWNSNIAAGEEPEYFEFTVVGKECQPDCPKIIVGSTKICAPSSEPVNYLASPENSSDLFPYKWEFFDPTGKKVTDKNIIDYTYPGQTYGVSVRFPEGTEFMEGNYKMTLKMLKVVNEDTTDACTAAVETTLVVTKRPTAVLLTDGEATETICPYNHDVEFSSKFTDKKWGYEWTNATAKPADPSKATVSFPMGICDSADFKAALKVYRLDNKECYAVDNKAFAIDQSKPVIACEKIEKKQDFFLSASATDTLIVMPAAEVSATCDPNPNVLVIGEGKLADGTDMEIEKVVKLLDLNAGKVSFTIPVTDNKDSEHGFRFTYQVSDSCGKNLSEECEFYVFVRDTFPPVVDCEKLAEKYDVSVNLSVFGPDVCQFIPGEHGFPLLEEPKAEDGLHPGVLITGQFDSRYLNGVLEEGKNLNDPYEVGVTTILWKFFDDALNYDSCFQTVTVTDDKKPETLCPEMKDFTVRPDRTGDSCTVSADSLIFQIKEQLKLNDMKFPMAVDRCENADTLKDPQFWYRVAGDDDWIKFDDNTVFEIKKQYELEWRFYKKPGIGVDETVYAACGQTFRVVGEIKPQADCDAIPDSMYVVAPSGTCEATYEQFLDSLKHMLQPWPAALFKCTGDKIPGQIVRKDGEPWNKVIKVGEVIDVLWLFTDPNLTTGVDTCEKTIKLISDIVPLFNCDDIPDTLRVTAPTGECAAPLQAFMDSLKAMLQPWPTAKEYCTGDPIPGKIVMADGSPLPSVIPVGPVLSIKWVFEDPTKTTGVKICEKSIRAVSDKLIDGDCGNIAYSDISIVVKNGECKLPADTVKLVDHLAPHPCLTDYIIKAVPVRADGLSMADSFPVGATTVINWVFRDTTHSLVTDTSVCPQKVHISDGTIPEVGCDTMFPRDSIYLDADNCFADSSMIEVHINAPVHPCTGKKATVTAARADGQPMQAPFAVGKHTVIWTLAFSDLNKFTCHQQVEVFDTIAPDFDCSTLKNYTIEHRDAVNPTIPFKQLVDSGFVMPTATDKCCEVTITTSRSDGKQLEDDYPVGYTTVYFFFADDHNNVTRCSMVVHVTDMIPPTITCPSDFDGDMACLGEMPAPYTTFQEFVAAGGKVDPIEKVIIESFRHEDVTVGNSCNSTTTRTYMFTLVNGESAGCFNPQKFVVKDTIAPVLTINASGNEINTTCDVLDTIAPSVSVADNCDPAPELTVERVSTQGTDESKCDYYQYDVIFTYNAVDRCGNAAATQVFTIHVKNEKNPEVALPEDWDKPVYPEYVGNCQFAAPDVTELLPTDSISLVCGLKEYLKIYQTPPAGTHVTENTTVYLTIEDVCGNKTVLTKQLKVQSPEQILKVTINPDVVKCGKESDRPREADNNLTHSSIRLSNGTVMVKDELDGEYVSTGAKVVWDCYRDSISPESIVYSDNKRTYGMLFQDAATSNAAFAKYNLLTRRKQSGVYIYVATDTITGCTASGSTYIDVREAPRLSISDNSFNLCDGDSLPVSTRFADENPVCIDDCGSPVTAQGWMLNGAPYVPHTPVHATEGDVQTSYFYATNECGTTTTLNSLYTTCSGAPSTVEDSVAEAGSVEEFLLWREDKHYIHDSVLVNVYQHTDPKEVLLTTSLGYPSRVWNGEQAELVLTTPYNPAYVIWMKTQGEYDGMADAIYNHRGEVVSGGSRLYDDIVVDSVVNLQLKAEAADHENKQKNRLTIPEVSDTSSYYVLVGNGVCPTVSSNLVRIDVAQVPTAFTPYDRDGFNDFFMPGHPVVIFNRYGGRIFEGSNGWDGTSKGLMVDPGVYYYEVVVSNKQFKGSIEVVKTK